MFLKKTSWEVKKNTLRGYRAIFEHGAILRINILPLEGPTREGRTWARTQGAP